MDISEKFPALVYGEICHMINFKKTSSNNHHQNNDSFLSSQQRNVKAITDMLLSHELSFDAEVDHTLYNIITDAIVPANAVQQIINTEGIGQVGYEQFVEDHLKVNSKIPIWDPMKKFYHIQVFFFLLFFYVLLSRYDHNPRRAN